MRDITEELRDSDKAAEAIEPSPGHRVWKLEGPSKDGYIERLYTQEPLSFFGKQQFVTLVNGYVDRFVKGELGVDLKDLLSDAGNLRQAIPTGDVTPADAERAINENIGLVRGVVRLIQELPGFEVEIMLLSLGVPRHERDWARETVTGPVSRGGLTDEQGFDILKTFITQNATDVRSFFEQRGRDLVEHFQATVFPRETTKEDDDDTPGGMLSNTSSLDIQGSD